jgi:ankyrin repeat protein
LHWACYQGGEEAIYYLLAWLEDINKQDNRGKTPLHSAIENITKFKQLRPIKEMLIKGASREITDHQGLRPLDLVDIAERNSGLSEQFRVDLQAILGKQPLNIPCSQIKPPLAKLRRNF